ncbi:heme utilization cystosolic carrier protein HutX [Geothrix sp. 21YS21S-4]|uniref:heme utilization cystosolic carrier protein HutX n=1 Tax=Geothrix sp. 21YS21S-4 TaxID=3068889 RepID=UPI0027B9E130|nr:heme utilization cystosolic carrier protein HutX [Geothrix sp. 21YS21S-4]
MRDAATLAAAPILHVEGVGYAYPFAAGPALKELDFGIRPGEAVLCTGPSGCGKSTLIRLLNGLAPHHYRGRLEGRVAAVGRDTQTISVGDLARQVGTLFQDPEHQFLALNVADELAFAHEWRGAEPGLVRRRIVEAARRLGIQHLLERSVHELSEGQKQRVALAGLLSLEPAVLLLDEPSANLDPEATRDLAGLLADLKAAGLTLFIVDHRLYWLRDLVDRVLVMADGRLILDVPFECLDEEALRAGRGLRKARVEDLRNRLPDASVLPAWLELRDLAFGYPGHPPLFDGLSLDLPKGQVVGLVGPNGAGKTTLARLLGGLLPLKRGTLRIGGAEVRNLTGRVGLVLQNTDHQLHMRTVREELLACADPADEACRDRVEGLLTDFRLAALAHRHPQSLSGGEKQRLVLAMSLLRRPELLILDEPTSGLDGGDMGMIADHLEAAAREGACVLLISHDLELLERVCTCRADLGALLHPSSSRGPMTTLEAAALTEQIQATLDQQPGVMLSALAAQLGLPEGDVLPLLPAGMATPAPVEAFEEIWEDLRGWQKATFLAVTPGAVVEVAGPLPRGQKGHGMFNLHEPGNPLGGHLLIERLGAIWFVSKPHFGKESHSVQFYTREGQPMFGVYVGRSADRALLPDVKVRYLNLRRRFEKRN